VPQRTQNCKQTTISVALSLVTRHAPAHAGSGTVVAEQLRMALFWETSQSGTPAPKPAPPSPLAVALLLRLRGDADR